MIIFSPQFQLIDSVYLYKRYGNLAQWPKSLNTIFQEENMNFKLSGIYKSL